jgi:hypothetical protein
MAVQVWDWLGSELSRRPAIQETQLSRVDVLLEADYSEGWADPQRDYPGLGLFVRRAVPGWRCLGSGLFGGPGCPRDWLSRGGAVSEAGCSGNVAVPGQDCPGGGLLRGPCCPMVGLEGGTILRAGRGGATTPGAAPSPPIASCLPGWPHLGRRCGVAGRLARARP